MILSVEELKKYITCEFGLEKDQIQVNGIDLRLNKVFQPISFGTVFSKEVKIPPYKEIFPESVEGMQVFALSEGYYIIEFFETIEVPNNAVGICFPRSSLLRMGCDIRTALWDSGYKGKSRALMVVYNNVMIERGARIAQIIFVRTENKVENTYSGKYQNEGLNK
jgi:Deoxycytidine deaminase